VIVFGKNTVLHRSLPMLNPLADKAERT
jgi:hypothetical protein